jgi:nucleoid DNA-binding protein
LNPKKAKEFIKPAAEKAEVSEKLANSLINFYWNRVRKEINEVKHYNITIENLGTFKLKHWKIDEVIDKYKKKVAKMEGSFVQFKFKQELENRILNFENVKLLIDEKDAKFINIKNLKNEKINKNLEI